MRIAIFIVTILCIPALAFPAVIYVPDDYPTIQEAIDAAAHGDTVIVKPGTYVENIDFLGKPITVMSEHGADVTVIDGGKNGSVVTIKGGVRGDTVLEGFTITNGTGTYYPDHSSGSYLKGGGILCKMASPTVIHCIIKLNEALNGAGMSNDFSSPTLIGCIFESNSAEKHGGGMHNWDRSSPTLKGCEFIENISVGGYGGGMYNRALSEPTLEYCLFSGNRAHSIGGGMYNQDSSPILTNCDFISNRAYSSLSGWGGGLVNDDSSPTLTECRFIGNFANYEGGGIYNIACQSIMQNCTFINNQSDEGGGVFNGSSAKPQLIDCVFIENHVSDRGAAVFNAEYSQASLINCIFSKNKAHWFGGAIYNHMASPVFTNCTFSGNWVVQHYGGAMYNRYSESQPILTNCILWGNSPDEIYSYEGTPDVSYCDIQGGYPGISNIDADPLFVDHADYDYHIAFNSPCRGSGDNSAVTELYDFEGDPRIYQGTVDIGADEFYTHLYCMGDFTPGGSIEGKFIGLPGASPVGLFLGFDVLDPPVPTAWGSFYLQPPVYLIPLMPVPANGVLVLPATIPAIPAAPYDLPMQALIGLNPDSLTNLFVLEVR
jgi:hypothetical protein